MKHFYLSLLLVCCSTFTFSQEEAEACLPPAKKILKLINAGVNAKDLRTAVTNFNEAMDADDENAMVYYEYGMLVYQNALTSYENDPMPDKGDRGFLKAEELFSQTLDLCSDYHANCSYYLGVINYTQKDMPQAIKWFKEFANYRHSDNSKYPSDFSKKLGDVKEVLADLEKADEVKTKVVPFEPSIVKNVSTNRDEYFPMISPDNEIMFFTRKEPRSENSIIDRSEILENFTLSRRASMSADFDKGIRESAPFNDGTMDSYGAATMSVDNKEMIVCGCKKTKVSNQPYMNCDLYITTFEKNERGYQWSPLVNMGDKINGEGRWDAQPSLSADGNTLYYTINGPNTQNNDIYIVDRKEDGTWGDPYPFTEINTPGKDKSPFLHQDSETLYFVSESTKDRPGVGGLDIYYIRKDGDGWTEPENIGSPINSPDDELGLFVSIDGEIAYFSSRQGGNWNIYSFELYEEARPQAVAILTGELKDEFGDPVEDATIEVMYEGSDEVTEVKVNGNDGKFATVVKKETKGDVMVTVKKKGHAFDSKIVAKEELKKEVSKIKDNDLNVKGLKVGEAYTINEILYSTNSAVMSGRSKFVLKGFARFLEENPTITVAIQGHTDDVGDDTENLKLSERRAQGVKNYLISLGIDKSRLSAKGYGETVPKVENSSEKNRAKNRRTDFVIEGM
ncbi:MAG: OmpA family protein [Crocinitomicaceae bacterium]|nr:OmpA family protein [Crocinitomicaceae bacterium]